MDLFPGFKKKKKIPLIRPGKAIGLSGGPWIQLLPRPTLAPLPFPPSTQVGLRVVPWEWVAQGREQEPVREVGWAVGGTVFSLMSDGFNINPLGAVARPQRPAPRLLIPGKEEVLGQDLLGFPSSPCQEKLLDIRGKQNH